MKNILLRLLESPELLAALWALITGLLSLFYQKAETRWPNAIAALRAGGLDLPRLAAALRPAFAWALEALRSALRRSPPIVALLWFAGCAAKQQLTEFAEASRDVSAIAEPCARAALQVELDRCKDVACVDAVEARYAAKMQTIDLFHKVLCTLAPETEGCEK